MGKQLVYDLPLRIFHWIFAGLFVFAFLIAKTADDESLTFSYHMMAGLLLGFVVLLRIGWGLVGTKYSRFSSFALSPKNLLRYFKGLLSGDEGRWAGHNPASSWAALVMMGLALGLGVTGSLMATGQKEAFEDIHEILANAFLVVVLMHVAGVVLHVLRHRDGLPLSVIQGRKAGVSPADGISSSRPVVALLFVGLVVAFAMHLARHFDMSTRTLNLFGSTLQLGESDGDAEE